MLGAAGKKGNSHYIGCLGKDAFGETMKTQLKGDGVEGHFLEVDDKPTGTCAVLVKDNERSLIANLAAAEKYDKAHFDSAEVQKVVAEAGIYYMAGFPLTHAGGKATVQAICEHSVKEGKTVCMNVSAPFLAEVPPLRAMLLEMFAMCDYVFCNESEAVSFGKGVETVEVTGNPWTLKKEDLVDTNGAGDAFVGGFLYGLSLGKSDAECAEAGHFAAGTIIQRAGCTFP